MSIGKVQINNLNLMQGEITAVENHLLFVGPGKGDKVGKLLTVNTDSDLSGVLAGADGLLAQVTAARDNGGQNWSGVRHAVRRRGRRDRLVVRRRGRGYGAGQGRGRRPDGAPFRRFRH